MGQKPRRGSKNSIAGLKVNVPFYFAVLKYKDLIIKKYPLYKILSLEQGVEIKIFLTNFLYLSNISTELAFQTLRSWEISSSRNEVVIQLIELAAHP